MNQAIRELQSLESLSKEDRWVNNLHPLVKLFVTALFLVLTVSFDKYNLAGLLSMAVYPLVTFTIADLSFVDAFKRLRYVLPIVCVVGIFNPFFDRDIVMQVGSLAVSGGVLSMLTLMGKAILTVLAGYLLIATTSMERICLGLRMLHVPSLLVTEILLIYRYLTVLLKETRRVTDSYALRAPGQKGIHISAWGSLAGLLLLRSMDRAERLYESMQIRGFHGEFYTGRQERMKKADWIYLAVWTAVLCALRFLPLTAVLGGWIA